MAKINGRPLKTIRRRGTRPWHLGAANIATGIAQAAVGQVINRLVGATENEKAQNQDTRVNLNSTFNATSLYTKTNRKRKYKSKAAKRTLKKKKTFTKRVKKIVRQTIPTSYLRVNFTTSSVQNGGPNTSRSAQDVWGISIPTDNAYYLAPGDLVDTNNKDLQRIKTFMEKAGHIEAGAIVNDAANNENHLKFWFSAEMHMDFQCFNSEFDDGNPLYVDIYECTAKSNIQNPLYSTPGYAWANLLAEQNLKHVGEAGRSTSNKGETPHQTKDFSKYWKIDQVTRIRVASNAPFHIKLTTSGIYNERTAKNAYALAGITRGIILVAGCITSSVLPTAWNAQLSGVHKFFKFKPMPTGNTQYPQISFSDRLSTTITP